MTLILPQIGGFYVPADSDIEASVTESPTRNKSGDVTTITLPGIALGADVTDREIFVVVSAFVSAGTFTGMTVGGVAASIETQITEGLLLTGIFKASNVTGTTGDIVINFSNTTLRQRLGAQVVRVVKSGGTTTSDVATPVKSSSLTTITTSVSATANDLVIAGGGISGNAGQPSFTGVTARATPYPDWDSGEYTPVGFSVSSTTETVSISSVAAASINRHCLTAISIG